MLTSESKHGHSSKLLSMTQTEGRISQATTIFTPGTKETADTNHHTNFVSPMVSNPMSAYKIFDES